MSYRPAHILVFIITLAAAAGAQSGPRDPLTGSVIRVSIEGNQRTPAAAIRALISATTGTAYAVDTVNTDIHALMRSNWFENVTAVAHQWPQGVSLLYRVRECPVVQAFTLTGGTAGGTQPKRLFTTAAGAPFSEAVWRADLQRVRTYFAKRHYHQLAIEVHRNAVPARRAVVLTVNIREGEPQRVERIDIRGAREVAERTIRAMLHCRAKNAWLFRSGIFYPERLRDDEERIADFYRANGFLDATVRVGMQPGSHPARTLVTLDICEGMRYRVSALTWAQRLMPSNEFAGIIAAIDVPAGSVFSPRMAVAIEEEVTRQCQADGQRPCVVRVRSILAPESTPDDPLVELTVTVLPVRGKR